MTDIEVLDQLHTLFHLLKRHRMSSLAHRDPLSDSTRGQGRILAILKMQSGISTRDLSYLLGIRQQSLNEMLNKLEKGGYVERRPSEKDRRVMLVHLTEKGRETEQQEVDTPDIFSGLNEQELDQFGDYLDRIIAPLKEKLGAENIPDPQHFSPDHEGPVPDRDGFPPFGRGRFSHRCGWPDWEEEEFPPFGRPHSWRFNRK